MNTFTVINTTDCVQIYIRNFTCKRERLFENILSDKDLRESVLHTLFNDYISRKQEYDERYCDGNRDDLVEKMKPLFGNNGNKYFYIILENIQLQNGLYIPH